MSLSAALSVESLSPAALYAHSARDLPELAQLYDSNADGRLSLDEFSVLLTRVLDQMAAQLPSSIPQRYCDQYGLGPSALEGVEARIAERFRALDRSALARAIFDELDTERRGAIEFGQLEPLHELMEKHVLKEMYEFIVQIIVAKQMQQYERL